MNVCQAHSQRHHIVALAARDAQLSTYSILWKVSLKAFNVLLKSKVKPNLPFTSFSFTNSVRLATETEIGISMPGSSAIGIVNLACPRYIGVIFVMLVASASRLSCSGSL